MEEPFKIGPKKLSELRQKRDDDLVAADTLEELESIKREKGQRAFELRLAKQKALFDFFAEHELKIDGAVSEGSKLVQDALEPLVKEVTANTQGKELFDKNYELEDKNIRSRVEQGLLLQEDPNLER